LRYRFFLAAGQCGESKASSVQRERSLRMAQRQGLDQLTDNFPYSGGIEAFHCPPSNIVFYWRLQSFPCGGLSFLPRPEVVLVKMNL
jgi:hypothetical protein